MTFRTESRITIENSIDEAWAYICDVDRWPEWAPTVLECWVRGGAPLEPGSRVEQRAKGILGTSRGRSQEMTAAEAPRSLAFAGPLGTSRARWGMEFEPVHESQTDAMMWIEVDLAGPMRAIPGRLLQRRIQRVSDLEMTLIKAAVESAPVRRTGPTQARLIETYRRKARHYDLTSRLYPIPGYPQTAQRLRAVRALGLRPGDTVVDVCCGTGLNFPLLQEAVGPHGRIVGVDLTDAMLARAQDRVEANDWKNVTLVQSDAAAFEFPSQVEAIVSTYALSQVPECAQVIAHGATALSEGGRWVVLDLKVPSRAPRWLTRLGTATARPFASIDEWIARRPWEVIRAAMQEELSDPSWTELFFGTAFLAAGSGIRPSA